MNPLRCLAPPTKLWLPPRTNSSLSASAANETAAARCFCCLNVLDRLGEMAFLEDKFGEWKPVSRGAGIGWICFYLLVPGVCDRRKHRAFCYWAPGIPPPRLRKSDDPRGR